MRSLIFLYSSLIKLTKEITYNKTVFSIHNRKKMNKKAQHSRYACDLSFKNQNPNTQGFL